MSLFALQREMSNFDAQNRVELGKKRKGQIDPFSHACYSSMYKRIMWHKSGGSYAMFWASYAILSAKKTFVYRRAKPYDPSFHGIFWGHIFGKYVGRGLSKLFSLKIATSLNKGVWTPQYLFFESDDRIWGHNELKCSKCSDRKAKQPSGPPILQ